MLSAEWGVSVAMSAGYRRLGEPPVRRVAHCGMADVDEPPFAAGGSAEPATVAERIIQHVGAHCSSEVIAIARISGGDTAAAYRCTLADDRVVFAKTLPDADSIVADFFVADFFIAEATGLRWLAAAGGRVPEVLGVDESVLTLAWIEERGGQRGAGRPRGRRDGQLSVDAEFGAMLARLHDAPLESFGRPDRRTTGSRRLPNEPRATWAEFFRTQRLEPLAELAGAADALPPAAVDALGALGQVLAEFDDDVPPAQLHGDLWAGNRLVDVDGRNWLIDPQAHGGHPEYDIAMMRLFGGFGPDCYAEYSRRRPPRAGWERRVPLHQLAPLTTHAIKFGGGYVGATCDALDRCWAAVGRQGR